MLNLDSPSARADGLRVGEAMTDPEKLLALKLVARFFLYGLTIFLSGSSRNISNVTGPWVPVGGVVAAVTEEATEVESEDGGVEVREGGV